MANIASFFIRNYKLTIVLSFGLLIMGIQGLKNMNAESYPTVDFAQAIVTTVYRGASAEDIEAKITKPIEDEIRGVTGLKDVKSVSQPGISTIFIRVDIDNADVEKAMNDLQKAVDRAQGLPADLEEKPGFAEIKSEEFPVYEIAITGPNENRERDLIADLLKEEIEDNSAVKEARLTGFANRRFIIHLDYKKLAANHIGINEVLGKIQARNLNIPGGELRKGETQNLIRLEGKVQSSKDIEEIIIRTNFNGNKIQIKDVARVEDGAEELNTLAQYQGEPATLVIANKKGGADTLAMVADLKVKLANFEKRYGDTHQFAVYHDEAEKVQDKLDVLESNAVQGLLLVIVFLFIFLPGKIGLMASLSLPLAVFGTIGVMGALGYSLNSITILALIIALGMLVDNAVVIAENFTRLRKDGLEPLDAATESIRSLWLPITATAFTTIAAFLPMLVTTGIMGQFIKYIPVIVTASLLLSLAESFLFLPMRLVMVNAKIGNEDGSPAKQDWFFKLEEKFEALMHKVVKKRYWMMLAFFGIVFTSFYLIGVANKFILFPAEQTELYIGRIQAPVGTRIEVTQSYVDTISKQVKEVLGENAKHIIGRAGTSKVRPDDPKAQDSDNVGMLMIYVSDYAKDNIYYTEILEKLRGHDYGVSAEVSFEEQINGPPVGNPIEATFRSNSDAQLVDALEKLKLKMAAVDGVLDIKIDDVISDDEVWVDINYAEANRLGLTVRSIGDAVKVAGAGVIASDVTLENKDVDLLLRFRPEDRKDIADLGSVQIMDNQGNLVPLSTVAKFRTEAGTPFIKRYDFKRSKTLLGSVDETKITAVAANAKLLEEWKVIENEHPAVSIKFGGVAESTNESMASLANALVLSLIGIFALMVFLFRSYLRPFIIMTTIPLGLLGFAIAFYLHDRPVSFLALIGIIGLGGIIVNSGIVLISFIDEMRAEGKLELDVILAKASRLRLRAVMVSSLTTISGLLPTAYGIGGADSMLIPMTLAMAWGLTSGTLLTLIWIPPAYAILEDWVALMVRIKDKFFSRSTTTENSSKLIEESR
ncbi:MAG: hypothetical protein CME71_03620 [Halobacteriovorax sp.]|nr:hypothetical protein [Halobacteriovorax sp.]